MSISVGTVGQVRLEHVNVFAYGLKHIGDDVVTDSIGWLLGVAKTSEPGELFAVMKQLRAAVCPDGLDQAWAKGADKAHRHVDAIDELASSILESGLASDQGFRPHLSVRVDAETLDGQPGEPATLDGFGPIGPELLACSGERSESRASSRRVVVTRRPDRSGQLHRPVLALPSPGPPRTPQHLRIVAA